MLVRVGLIAAGLAVSSSALGAVRLVDDDKQQCKKAPYTTIQAAVAAASPGDLIVVCPGLYAESVQIPIAVWLRGSGPGPQNRTGDPSKEAVVTPPGATNGFDLLASNIVVEEFTFQGATRGFHGGGAGVSTIANESGYLIRQNALLDNDVGIRLRSSGVVLTRVEQNQFTDNETHLENSGDAISFPGLRNAEVQKNDVIGGLRGVDFQSGAIAVQLGDNRFEGTKTTIQIAEATDCQVSGNRIEQTKLGIQVRQSSNLVIDQNRISDVISSAGIEVRGSDHIQVLKNHVERTVGPGIVVRHTFASTVGENHVRSSNRSGIQLEGVGELTIEQNKTFENAENGIWSDADSEDNVFSQNVMLKNGVPPAGYDARDDNRGGNVWVKNVCRTDFPPATICDQ